MKLQLLSDLHMEFLPFEVENAGADVLILSGDICVVDYLRRGPASPYAFLHEPTRLFFQQVSDRFKQTILVLGNHEHYDGRFNDTAPRFKEYLRRWPNIHLLDNEYIDLDGVRFFGSTLWTDFGGDNFAAKLSVETGLSDYRYIQYRAPGDIYRKLKANDTYFYHVQALRALEICRPDIVVGHHAPSYKSIKERYRSEGLLNYGYYSDLERFIEANEYIKLWTHGHVHNTNDYYLGDTRVISNPRGYAHKYEGRPENVDFDPGLIINV